MAVEIRAFAVTVEPGSSSSAPVSFDVSFPPRVVRRVEVVVPDGPRGNVGFQVGAGGSGLLFPANGGFFITNNETVIWDLETGITSGSWQVIAYNAGQYSHTLFFRFLLDPVPSAAPLQLQPVAVSP